MGERKADVCPRHAGEAGFEILAARAGGAGEGLIESLETADGQRVEQGLLVGEVAARRGVAHADEAAEPAEGDFLRAAVFEGSLRRLKQGFAEIAVMVGACGCLHWEQLKASGNKLQHVSIDNKVTSGYIAAR